MKRLLLIPFLAGYAFASPTYFFITKKVTKTKEDYVVEFSTKGKSGNDQPFFGTYVLPRADGLFIIKITPSNENELEEVKSNFNNPDIGLYQIWDFDKSVNPIVDNSELYPETYEVIKSS